MFNRYQAVVVIAGSTLTLLAVWVLSMNASTQATATVIDNTAPSFSARLQFDTSKELHNYFATNDFTWPIEHYSDIPALSLQKLPKDLKEIKDVKLRKSLFIRIMLPIIYAEQKQLRQVRSTIISQLNQTGDKAVNQQWFKQLLAEYNVSAGGFIEQRDELLARIDELPTTLILAQAAIESGWGTSRFAREGNSLFGQWTFNKGDGLVPENRESGKSHQVKAFDTLRASVRSYLKNINRNRAYKELRQWRQAMREKGQPLDAIKLAQGLHRYSQKGQAYVDILHSILNSREFKLVQTIDGQRPA